MKPDISTIFQLFNGSRVFKIPFYQRSYVWGEKQWERFLSDMRGVGTQVKDYFLGAIILKQLTSGAKDVGDYKLVIDGQQRLTTISIFLKVLYLKLGQNKWFERRFIMPDDNMSLAIQHSHIDREDFEKIMRLTEFVENIDGVSNIILAYNYFAANLKVEKLNIDRVMHHVHVIDIVINELDDEQQIFNTINSLGVDLTTAELLKNHLFDEKSIPQYEKYWKPVFEKDEDCLRFWAAEMRKGRTMGRNVDVFLNAYLQIKVHEQGKNISATEKDEYAKSSALFSSYQHFIAAHFMGKEMDFVKDLTQYAHIYYETFTPDITDHTIPSESGLERVNFMIYAMDGTTMIPFVMYVMKNVQDEKERNKIFDYLEAYIVRRVICHKSSNNYSDLFSENLIGNGVQTVEDFVAYINEKDSSNALAMPDNQELLSGCLNTQHPNYRGLAILYMLESRLRNDSMLTTQLQKYSAYTLEHLMPQKWHDNWPLPDDIKESTRIHKIKTLGNFTIITQSLNSSIGNNKWSVKLTGNGKHKGLKEYASGLLTLKDTLLLPEWNEQTIDGRATWLAYKASILWPSQLPSDEAIEEPEFEEGVVTTTIVNEDEDVANVSYRDQTRYSLDGQNFLAKSYFVHEFVSRYIRKHPKITFEELKTIFPDSFLESKHRVRGLLFKKEDYDAWTRPDKAQRYGTTREGALLKTQVDGVEFYVNTQWTLTSVQHIIAIAKEDGFDVMIKL